MTSTTSAFRSGFIAIVGAPNVGKSTLLNRLLAEKISITSRKPQTTRNRILGVVHRERSQMIFVDTPGIHRSGSQLNVRIVDAALAAIGDADLLLMIADAWSPDPDSENLLIENLRGQNRTVILALNKIDRIDKPSLLSQIDRWSRRFSFEAIVPISARMGTQVDVLLSAMEKVLPPGPPLFPEDAVTDAPMRFLAAEIVREKVFRYTGDEIPYATAVTVDEFNAVNDRAPVRISATIHVERDSQKGIVIGKKGGKLRQIGAAAREDLEKMMEKQVVLNLFVRVQKNWSRDGRALRKFGY
ncbi:MAG: GTPase Era [Desulfobacterales bacterium]|nr:GTPase Era [Desulfobacterales bacterium]